MKKILLSIAFLMCFALSVFAQKSLNQGIVFGKDSINIAESQMARLELVVEYIRSHPKETIIIGGFTSTQTPDIYVDTLCQKRADNVKDLLVKKYNIPAEQLLSIGVGRSTKYEAPEFNEVVEFFIH